MLKVENLKANIGEVQILNGIDLTINKGELHAVMGPNGSGKSTLCHVLMGNPDYESSGKVYVDETEVLETQQFERSNKGIFQSVQYPVGLLGVSLREFVMVLNDGLCTAVFINLAKLCYGEQFVDRDANAHLSCGEKKRSERFPLALKKPKIALLD